MCAQTQHMLTGWRYAWHGMMRGCVHTVASRLGACNPPCSLCQVSAVGGQPMTHVFLHAPTKTTEHLAGPRWTAAGHGRIHYTRHLWHTYGGLADVRSRCPLVDCSEYAGSPSSLSYMDGNPGQDGCTKTFHVQAIHTHLAKLCGQDTGLSANCDDTRLECNACLRTGPAQLRGARLAPVLMPLRDEERGRCFGSLSARACRQ
jgi:hypothetical protein